MAIAASTAISGPPRGIDRAAADGLRRAAGWLVRVQEHDGHWRDYDIDDQVTLGDRRPIGPSDQWVTAYAGLALGEASHALGSPARAAAHRAADWLVRRRTYAAGWGFNGRTGPDVDSTSHALLLMRRLGRRVLLGDVCLVAAGAQPGGGFATFPGGPGQWGQAHADITPAALLSLPSAWREPLRAPAADFLRRSRSPHGWWPSYWWRTPNYATYFALRADRALGLGIDVAPLAGANREPSTDACDAAFAAGIVLHRGGGSLAGPLLDHALSCQHDDGGWAGTASLRVPRQDDAEPWTHTASPAYRDVRGVLTTAHIVRVLARIAAGPDGLSESPPRPRHA